MLLAGLVGRQRGTILNLAVDICLCRLTKDGLSLEEFRHRDKACLIAGCQLVYGLLSQVHSLTRHHHLIPRHCQAEP